MRSPKFIAMAISVLAVVWVASGLFGGKDDTAPQEPAVEQSSAAIPDVRVQSIAAEPYVRIARVTGRTQAARMVEIRAEIDAQVAALLAEKGKIVKKDEMLAKLDVRDRAARVEETRQLVNQREIQYNAAEDLAARGFNSKVRLAEARAQLEAARAALKEARVDLANTVIRAPFDGVVTGQAVEQGDYVRGGDALVTIAEMDPIELAAYVTEKQVIHIKQGADVSATLLTGQDVTGKVTYIAPAADVQTRTFLVEMSLPNPDLSIRDGLTAEVDIPLETVQATPIPPSVIALADDGTLGVKLVEEGNVARFTPIILLRDTGRILWVEGLPDPAVIITVGQEFVGSGERVNPVAVAGPYGGDAAPVQTP